MFYQFKEIIFEKSLRSHSWNWNPPIWHHTASLMAVSLSNTTTVLSAGDRPGMLCSFRIPGAWSCAWSLNIQANNCFSTGELRLPPQVPRVKDFTDPKPLSTVPLPRPRVTLSAHLHLCQACLGESWWPAWWRDTGSHLGPAVTSWPSSLLLRLVGLGRAWYKVSQEWTFCWIGMGFPCVESSPPPSFTGRKRVPEVINRLLGE